MVVIGVAGGTGSGKSAIVREVVERLPRDQVAVLPADSYYKDLAYLPEKEREKINFDHPDSIDFDLLISQLADLKRGIAVQQPVYSYLTCLRSQDTLTVSPASIIFVEGILIFANQELCDLLDVKVFVDVDADERLIRLIKRDTAKRGRTMEDVLMRYENVLKPMHAQFVEPGRHIADIIIPRGKRNKIAIDMLVQYIQNIINGEELK